MSNGRVRTGEQDAIVDLIRPAEIRLRTHGGLYSETRFGSGQHALDSGHRLGAHRPGPVGIWTCDGFDPSGLAESLLS